MSIRGAVSGVFFSFPYVLWCRDRENPKQGERGVSLPGEKRMLSLAGNVGLLPGRQRGRKWEMAKKNPNILCVFSACWLDNQSARRKSTNFFAEKCLTVGSKRRIKRVRANEPATSERATGKEIFPDGKKVLDAGLKMRHKSPSRQRVAPTGPRKKTFAKMKKLVDSENEAA